MAKDICRILCIDGGGVRGLVPAIWLVRVEQILRERHGKRLDQYFDYVAGTSTGSIIAASIAAGISAEKVVRLYEERAEDIFPYQSRWSPQRLGLIFTKGFSAPKYDYKGLVNTIKREIGNKKLGDVSTVRLLIPFYDTIDRSTQFFKNYPDVYNKTPKFKDVPLWEAAVCSSSAPTFFPAHKLQVGKRVYSAIDGGVAANNPVACVMADAVAQGYQPGQLRILSLGTGSNTRPIPLKKAQEWGTIEWAQPVIDVLMDGALDVYRHIAEMLVGKENLLRVQFELVGKNYGLDKLDDDMDNASRRNLANLRIVAEKELKKLERKETLTEFLG